MAKINWTESQSAAINARGSALAVSAAAGSGKTAVLTQRIIEKLWAGEDISRMLVVTFTTAAAADLREKIRSALSKAMVESPDSRHMARQLIKLSGAKISTISSFCLSLVKSNYRAAGLASDFGVLSETQDVLLRKNVADELISDFFYGRVTKEEADIPDFAAFADTFGKPGNDEALAESVSDIYDKLSSTALFEKTLAVYKSELEQNTDDFAKTKFGKSVLAYILKLCKHYKNIFDSMISYAHDHDEVVKYAKTFAEDSSFVENIIFRIERGDSWDDIKNEFVSHSFSRLDAIRGYSPTAEVSYYREARDEFKKAHKSLCEDIFIFGGDSCAEGARLLQRAIGDLYEFMKLYRRRLDAEKRRRHALAFADIEHKALSLVTEADGSPTPLALSMREDFDEIYIDEYQDTNEVQDKIFNALSKGDNRFVVGDIKQCIYAFRSADPSIFEALIKRSEKYGAENTAKEQKIFLSKNFRSTDEILEFSNAVFEMQMERGGVMSYGSDERLYGKGKHGDKVHIGICLRETADKEREPEAEYVAGKIAELLSTGRKNDGTPISASDVVIILRSMKSRAHIFRAALEARGIPCEDLATERFFESPEVLLAVSLLNVIDNPERDIYLAATLKSPLYGVTLSELIYIRKYASGSLFDALRKFTGDKDFAKGKRFLEDYERYREAARMKPCDELIWQIYLEKEILSLVSSGEGEDMNAREAARANLVQLYNYARSFSGSAFRGLYDFLSFISDVIENGTKLKIPGSAGEANAVKIITSHGSKGLEYPVCFVSGCGAELNKRDASADIIVDKELGIIPKVSSSYGLERVNTPQRAAASLAVNKNACNEEMRVLYVALTRAKEKLFITGEVHGDIEKNRSKYNIMPSHGGSYFEYEGKYFSPYSAANSKNYLEMILPAAAGRSDLCTFEMYCGESKDEEKANEAVAAPVSVQEDTTTFYAAKKLVEERFSFEYPHASLCSVPSKLSVSRLFPNILDEDDGYVDVNEQEPEEAPKPKFMLAEAEKASGAQKGNATHLFMQFFDFDSVEKLGIEGEIARLAREKFIFPADAELINRYALRRFFGSELAKKMRKSKRIYREKRFIINYPAENFSEDEQMRESLRGEKLMVQGIIDCAFFDETGELILVDYKTDSFWNTPEDEAVKILRERHSRQIGYYKYACEKMFGAECAHAYIYSFALNKTIEI